MRRYEIFSFSSFAVRLCINDDAPVADVNDVGLSDSDRFILELADRHPQVLRKV